MTPQEEKSLFGTLGRLDERTKTTADDVAEVKAELGNLREAAHTRINALKAQQEENRRAFESQTATCEERFTSHKERVQPWYQAVVQAIVAGVIAAIAAVAAIIMGRQT